MIKRVDKERFIKLIKRKMTIFIYTMLLLYGGVSAFCVVENLGCVEAPGNTDEANVIWKYKYINGVLYKRGYNTRTKEYVTEWIRAKE